MGLFTVTLCYGVALATPGEPVLPEFPVAPPPRLAGPPVAVVPLDGGYQLRLNRWAAGQLQTALDQTDEKDVAAKLREMAKEKKEGATPDEVAAGKLELIAFLVANQLPGFKKALRDNTGPGGAVVTVTGLQAPAVKFGRPRLDRAADLLRGAMPLLPPDARDAVEALRAMGRTTPLAWKVEPRE